VDTLFFIASKVVWGLIRPESWIVIALAVAFVLFRRRPRLSRILVGGTIVATLVIGYVPVGSYLIRSLEARYPADPPLTQVDGIIILGGAEETGPSVVSGQPEFNAAGERITATAMLALAHPEARVVISGGSGALVGPRGPPGNADLHQRVLLGFGISPDRILLEPLSRNTAENAAFSLSVADPQPGETWVLVTSAWHMPRAMDTFDRAGWPDLVAWPVDHRGMRPGWGLRWALAENLIELNTVVKEWVGAVAYSWTGR
jgi:uncharacterized SAM-binding protein YcdF (DUF218 family)